VQQIAISSVTEHQKTRTLLSERLAKLTLEDNEGHTETRNQVFERIDDLQAVTLFIAQRDKFLRSLNFQGRDQRINDVKEAHHKTFQWLFDDNPHTVEQVQGQHLARVYEKSFHERHAKTRSSFKVWLKSEDKVFWISAKAGAGKSTLMKFLSRDSRTKSFLNEDKPGNSIILTHFFYLMGSPMQCNINGLLSTLLYQLLREDKQGDWIAELFLQGQYRDKESDSNWSEAELKMALLQVLHMVPAVNRVCMFLDGLDEIHPSEGKPPLLNFLDWLRVNTHVKLCVSSRPEGMFNVPHYFAHSHGAEISEHVFRPISSKALDTSFNFQHLP
jgi:hypothetical protein